MSSSRLFERKSLEVLNAEAGSDQRLHRVLGPVALTSLGVGAIIGAGIFAMTGRVAASDAGPAVVLSFVVAGVACLLAGLCYSEFASMVPVAGSAYTYTYATLGELAAWIIGWDLILEYAMSCAVVAAHWTAYLNEFLRIWTGYRIRPEWCSDPFTPVTVDGVDVQAFANLPAIAIIAITTWILVIGIKESARANTFLVIVKVAVVLFVIMLGAGFVDTKNWTAVPIERRQSTDLSDYLHRNPKVAAAAGLENAKVDEFMTGEKFLEAHPEAAAQLSPAERSTVKGLRSNFGRWGMLGVLGIEQFLSPIDNAVRGPWFPYGLSGMMVGASLVFFAYIGFDSISTHSEEAVNPQKSVPFAILMSLAFCTLLYILVSMVLTGMEAYPDIDKEAPVAAAFRKRAELSDNVLLKGAAGLIATGALAGLTSVILVTFLSQARVFLAMARDGLLPREIFSVVHPKYRTPHRSTILTGSIIAITAGFMPIRVLEEMVSIGTLLAFAMVCVAVMILRVKRPEAPRPFRCPAVWLTAPGGILVTVAMMLFLPLDTWLRLAVWLGLGLVIYFAYGIRHSTLRNPLPGTPNSGQ